MLKTKSEFPPQIPDATGNVRMFLSSLAVGITNPAAILTFLFAVSWFGISGQSRLSQRIGLILGVFIGTYIWWGTLSGLVTIWKGKARNNNEIWCK